MDYNYHCHTYRCNHASGMPEEYIKRAIEGGIKYMGFSEHIPLVGPDGRQSHYRLKAEEAPDYFTELNELRNKYKEDVDIKIGFEVEYYQNYFEKTLKKAIEFGAEYLILGQHFASYDDEVRGVRTMRKTDDEAFLKECTEAMVRGIETGKFSCVAHPDIVDFVGDEKVFEDSFRRICVAAREYNTPLEINFLGIREGRNYPNEKIWRVAGEEKTAVTFGFDCHDVKSAYDGESLKIAMGIAEKYNLNYIGKPELKALT